MPMLHSADSLYHPGSICDLSYRQYERSYHVALVEPHTDRIPCLCNPPIASVLSHLSVYTYNIFRDHALHGSSSSKFSKYLLPNLSIAMNVPRFVSPAIVQSCSSYCSSILVAYPYTTATRSWLACEVAASSDKMNRTCIWWPYSWELLAFVSLRSDATVEHTLSPILRRLRRVRSIVDMAVARRSHSERTSESCGCPRRSGVWL